MNRKRIVGATLLLSLFVVLAPAVAANPVLSGVFHLLGRPYSLVIPPDGSSWAVFAETEPGGYWFVVNQTVYLENGDGVISVGDEVLGATTQVGLERLVVVGVSHLYRILEDGRVLMPVVEWPGSPVGQTWIVLSPPALRGMTHPVQVWTPIGHSGPEPRAGDLVMLGGTVLTLEYVDLAVEGDFGVPVVPVSWGVVKTRTPAER